VATKAWIAWPKIVACADARPPAQAGQDPGDVAADKKLYSILTQLVGQLSFGLAFILAVPAMAPAPTWAPLGFALILVASHLAMGLHLRHLGRGARARAAGAGRR
jgi:hypothetical protein